MRFKRSGAQLIGSRLFTRSELNSRLEPSVALDRGAFLGKLYGLYGKPLPRAGGFEYVITDTKTGLSFIAYVGRHGPSYGGDLAERSALRPVIEAFEQLVESCRAISCAHEYVAEYGNEKWVMGYRDGRSFDLPDRRGRKAPPRVERRHATGAGTSSLSAPGSGPLRSLHPQDRS